MGKTTYIDETGNRYGRLIVVKKIEPYKKGNKTLAQWFCNCDCGNECKVLGTDLRSGHTQSCGCLKKEMAVNNCKTHSYNLKGK